MNIKELNEELRSLLEDSNNPTLAEIITARVDHILNAVATIEDEEAKNEITRQANEISKSVESITKAKQEIFDLSKFYDEQADKAYNADNHDGFLSSNAVRDGLYRALKILKDLGV